MYIIKKTTKTSTKKYWDLTNYTISYSSNCESTTP